MQFETPTSEPQDLLGQRLAAMLDDTVTPDVSSRLAFAREQALQRARASRAPTHVGGGLLAISSWRTRAVVATLLAGTLLAAAAWTSSVSTDTAWEQELQYHAQAEND